MFYYFVVPLITRLVRTILLLLFSSPSSFPVRMLKALLPTSSPCCSTVVSFGSVLWAMAPSVNPQMDTSSGTFYADQFAGIQYARSCLVVDGKETVRAVFASSRSGVMEMARSRVSHNRIMLSSTGILYFFMASR